MEPLSKPLSIALERGHKVALIGAKTESARQHF